jgi:hypothetical protein
MRVDEGRTRSCEPSWLGCVETSSWILPAVSALDDIVSPAQSLTGHLDCLATTAGWGVESFEVT